MTHRPFSRVCLATILVIALPAAAGAETIELRTGASVEGEILRKRADSLVVDLGFTVLEVPMSEVVEIIDGAASTRPVAEVTDLFSIDPGRDELTVRENIDRCGEAVVQVRTPTGLGSGFIIHPDGYVVTNQHVVSGEHRLTITLFRRNENELQHVQFTDVRIVAMSPAMDLALLKIEDGLDRPLPVVPLGSDQELRQGQTVFAVGSPLGLDRTVSQGIVSLTNRVLGHQLLIQTTTEINPGNSGGPLFNLHGEVVGVNDLKLAGIGLEGLSFAIPVSTLREFLVNRNAFAFDPRNPNAGFRYNEPPLITAPAASGDNP